jgi:hypothetical protein
LRRNSREFRERRDELRVCQGLGENTSQLLGGVDLDQTHHTILDGFMSKMLSEVDVLGTLTATDDVVVLFDARSFVFIQQKCRVLE